MFVTKQQKESFRLDRLSQETSSNEFPLPKPRNIANENVRIIRMENFLPDKAISHWTLQCFSWFRESMIIINVAYVIILSGYFIHSSSLNFLHYNININI